VAVSASSAKLPARLAIHSDAGLTYSAASKKFHRSFHGDPKLSRLELQSMDVWWCRENAIREIQEGFREEDRPAYTTIQTLGY